MIKNLNLLVIATIFASYLEATTKYICGPEIEGANARFDTISMGKAGGFSGYRDPNDGVKILHITLESSDPIVEANIVPTYSTYDGIEDEISSMPYLPAWIETLYISGDATDWATLVLGNSGHTIYGPTLAPSAYGLPTPAPGTKVVFSLDKSPLIIPQVWFQGDLPVGCTIVVKDGSQTPYADIIKVSE